MNISGSAEIHESLRKMSCTHFKQETFRDACIFPDPAQKYGDVFQKFLTPAVAAPILLGKERTTEWRNRSGRRSPGRNLRGGIRENLIKTRIDGKLSAFVKPGLTVEDDSVPAADFTRCAVAALSFSR
ncbi:hypothetical protein EOS93_17610 [Rhizobium sp. RMa-01]|uniref:hypothetical protein n=1 Tax=unclassified Rhizobium TaxID=2613769 RepID=UPI0008DA96C6|nr:MULTISPECIES: hypothetical protein [unclassified Rhizobium]OHV19353.1 hypothetical protein BBJ66_15250 [Rhizobium sp. RSm-3]RVU09898.1 hypothetical protein EOS93_17610 [Rhizobium sp. RMa-01]